MYSIAQEDTSDITDKSHIRTACMVSNDEKAKKKKQSARKMTQSHRWPRLPLP